MSDTRLIRRANMHVTRRHPQTPLRLKEEAKKSFISSRRGPWLMTGLVLAMMLFFTRGRNTSLYTAFYTQTVRAQDRLVRSPGAPLSFLCVSSRPEDKFRLQGIVYSSLNPIAVINKKTCSSGETVAVRVGKEKEVIQCMAIERGWVDIHTSDGVALSLSLE